MRRKWVRRYGIFSAICATYLILMVPGAEILLANEKKHEEFFMSRARYAAHAACSRGKKANYQTCHDAQMQAARRIVGRLKAKKSEKLLNKTIECLQTVQVLPIKLRKRGLLWVEKCIS
ncbi:MAG: hypothetical protein ACR2OR_17765 [Hyphomicrobiales bacterium]